MLLMVLVVREHLDNPSSHIIFARGTTFLRSVPVSLVYKKSGLEGPNCSCHQPLIIMLMILPQLVTHCLRVERVKSEILACFVRTCTLLTFVLSLMKLLSCCKILLFLTNGFQQVIISCHLTCHWLMKWLIWI